MIELYGARVRVISRICQGARDRSDIDFVVIHDMESDNIGGVETYFRHSSPDEVGAHLGISQRGETRQWAGLEQLVYHARGGNKQGVGIELCGFASQARRVWLRRVRQRRALAKAIARICHEFKLGIPTHGKNVLGHYQIPAGGHSDPGPNFPWVRTMKLARKYYRKWYT